MGQDVGQARAALDRAAAVAGRTTAAGRWWSGYMVLIGVLAVGLIVMVEAVFPSFAARLVAAIIWAVVIGALGTWAQSHDVQPRGGVRWLLLAMAAWFAAYLVVLGPLVRWRAGTSLGWWCAAAVVMALPFPLAAWREWRRR
jgi:hypothetical protein